MDGILTLSCFDQDKQPRKWASPKGKCRDQASTVAFFLARGQPRSCPSVRRDPRISRLVWYLFPSSFWMSMWSYYSKWNPSLIGSYISTEVITGLIFLYDRKIHRFIWGLGKTGMMNFPNKLNSVSSEEISSRLGVTQGFSCISSSISVLYF